MTAGTRNGGAGKVERCVGTGLTSWKSFNAPTGTGVDEISGTLKGPGCVDLYVISCFRYDSNLATLMGSFAVGRDPSK